MVTVPPPAPSVATYSPPPASPDLLLSALTLVNVTPLLLVADWFPTYSPPLQSAAIFDGCVTADVDVAGARRVPWVDIRDVDPTTLARGGLVAVHRATRDDDVGPTQDGGPTIAVAGKVASDRVAAQGRGAALR